MCGKNTVIISALLFSLSRLFSQELSPDDQAIIENQEAIIRLSITQTELWISQQSILREERSSLESEKKDFLLEKQAFLREKQDYENSKTLPDQESEYLKKLNYELGRQSKSLKNARLLNKVEGIGLVILGSVTAGVIAYSKLK